MTAARGAKSRIAILGGGCGGLTAAWALTSTTDLRERFEVTVYEREWRLGGKCASGRAASQGLAGRRIEEHGLHLWFGFYAHAFRMLREVYDETGLARGEDWWRTPFEKCNEISLHDRNGVSDPKLLSFPATDGPPPREPRQSSTKRALARFARMLAADLSRATPRYGFSDRQVLGAMTDAYADAVGREGSARPGVATLMSTAASRVRPLLDAVQIALTILIGLRAEGGQVPNELDFRAWLKLHGASPDVVDGSSVLRGLYDLTFAYRSGNKLAPDLAAGKALQALVRILDYDGAVMWRMRAGMGDAVFAPLYLGLRQRGVRFQFFTTVTHLGLAPDEPTVDSIELSRHARVAAGPDAYHPLERIGAWWCWPAEPFVDQLDGKGTPADRTNTLRRGTDFDAVVLAIPVGALPRICTELASRSSHFRRMLDGARTVRTKSLQLWLTRPVTQLRGPGVDNATLDPPATGCSGLFDTYCDMSQLIPAEGGGDGGPQGVAYFCAVLPDDAPHDDTDRYVLAAARTFLEGEARRIWPRAFIGDEFDWNVLFDPEARIGPERLQAQFVRANTDPSDRYVNTPAGHVHTRLEPGRSTFDNVVLAGDWTRNEIGGGCVEAAVISGEQAAAALIDLDASARRTARPPKAAQNPAVPAAT